MNNDSWINLWLIPALLLLAAAPLIGAGTLLFWLVNGVWPDWSPAALGIEAPTTEWLGLNIVLGWLYTRSIGLLCLFAGATLIALPTAWLHFTTPQLR